MLNPTWSPDGNSIAFSGLVGGFTDLFVYDLDGEPAAAADDRSVRRARSGVVARRHAAGVQHRSVHDQPADARRRRPAAGGDRRRVRARSAPAGGFEGAKNISPQWTADGRALYFVSDRGGITNIYRTEFGGATTQLTNLLTGVSGITELSPALSAADGRLVFSAYEDNGYTIYALETPEQLAGTPRADAADRTPRCCRRAREGAGPVFAALQNETLGLPPESAAAAPAEEYKPKLGLDFAGQPTIGVGTRSVRHLRGRRRVVRVQRHARQPHARTPARR